jgi:hypothetical protein
MLESNRQPAGWVPERAFTFELPGERVCAGMEPSCRGPRYRPGSPLERFEPFNCKQDLTTMPRENDLEGMQDQGGKHGGQKGMPKPEPRPPRGPDQGIVRDEKGEEQPRDKARAQQVHRTDNVKR